MHYYQYYQADLETTYPYTSGTDTSTKSCAHNMSEASPVNVSYYETVEENNVSQMKAALEQQPLSVLIEADKRVFQMYSSGVFTDTSCGTSLDHAVLAVGYGTENGQEYWLVKNSWDTTWGDQGYIKIAIVDGEGICGVQMAPAYPTAN